MSEININFQFVKRVFGVFKSEKEAVYAMNEIALRGFSAFYAVSANNGGAT